MGGTSIQLQKLLMLCSFPSGNNFHNFCKTLWSETDMSNLRLINETTGSSVSSIEITDVF